MEKKCFYKPQKKKGQHFVRFQAGFHKREAKKDFIQLHNLALGGQNGTFFNLRCTRTA